MFLIYQPRLLISEFWVFPYRDASDDTEDGEIDFSFPFFVSIWTILLLLSCVPTCLYIYIYNFL